jgi:hypothetical protein
MAKPKDDLVAAHKRASAKAKIVATFLAEEARRKAFADSFQRCYADRRAPNA